MKHVYLFGPKITQGNAKQIKILGGKGANLAEMSNLGIPVPPGFTITTNICNSFLKKKKCNKNEIKSITQALNIIEEKTKKKLGDPINPLL